MSAERDLMIAEAVRDAYAWAGNAMQMPFIDLAAIIDTISPETDAIDAARYRALRAELMSNEDGPIAHALMRLDGGHLNNRTLTLDKFDECIDIGMAMSALADPPKWKCRDCGNSVDSDHRGCR